MNPVSVDISIYLKNNLSYTPGTDLFISVLPVTPIEVVSLFDTSGAPPLTTIDGETNLRDSFQVIVRSNSYQTAWSKALAITKKLHGLSNLTINNQSYQSVWLQNGPNVLSSSNPTEKGQSILSINFNIIRKQI